MNSRANFRRPTPLAGAPLQPLEYYSNKALLYDNLFAMTSQINRAFLFYFFSLGGIIVRETFPFLSSTPKTHTLITSPTETILFGSLTKRVYILEI